jgi:hypothetical protein
MTARKPFTLIAAILFAAMAAIHVYRLAMPFDVMVGHQSIPYAASIGAAVLLAIMAIMLVRESRR